MNNSERNLSLASTTSAHNETSRSGVCVMRKDEMLLKLLDELLRSWMETSTPTEIGSDLDKVRLLKEARAAITEGVPSQLVQAVYREVFLRDVWSGVGGQSGSPA